MLLSSSFSLLKCLEMNIFKIMVNVWRLFKNTTEHFQAHRLAVADLIHASYLDTDLVGLH